MALFNAAWAASRLSQYNASLVATARSIVVAEGGEVNHPADRGGFTIYGITMTTARNYGPAFDYDGDGVVSVADMRKITPDIAAAFFIMAYAVNPGIAALPEALQPITFDMSVNSGPVNAIRALQQTLNRVWGNEPHVRGIVVRRLVEDGKSGPATNNMAQSLVDVCGADVVVNAMCDTRESFYRKIVVSDPSQNVFLKGWLNRIAKFRPSGFVGS